MPKSFRDALVSITESTSTSLRAVAIGADVSYEQLKKLKQNKSRSTNVDDAVKIANWFGMSLDEFIGDDTRAKRDEILALYNSLNEQERAVVLAAAKGVRVRPPAED